MNKNIVKNLITLSLFGLIFGGYSYNNSVFAQYYGGNGNNPKVTIDKKVRPITDSTFYDNVDPGKYVFVEGDQIEFKLVVQNTGNSTLTNVKVTDFLPKYLNLIFYPGTLDVNSNEVITQVGNLDPGVSKEYIIRATISDVPASSVSYKKLQMTNKASVNTDQTGDSDNASYFISLKSMPNTGSNDLLVESFVVTVTGISAFGLRKLARGY